MCFLGLQEFLSCLEDLRRLPSSFTIVTSRIKLVMGPDCAPYLLDKLDLAPAMELLVLTAGPGIKWGDMQLDDLAGICGCNAFALVIIGSFLNMKIFTVEVNPLVVTAGFQRPCVVTAPKAYQIVHSFCLCCIILV